MTGAVAAAAVGAVLANLGKPDCIVPWAELTQVCAQFVLNFPESGCQY